MSQIIAVAGKGGVGKTSISAAFVRILIEQHPEKRILAIDADPAIGLATALGVNVTSTLDDIRKSIVTSVEAGNTRDAIEMLSEARYRIFETMIENRAFSFLAIGRPEAAGCYCKVNAYLKEVIELLSKDFDYVVIDGEAGIEQINRRVMEKVTDLILISDPSKKGTNVIETIRRVADELVMYNKCGAIINRLSNPELKDCITVSNTEILSYIPVDNAHGENDIRGLSVFDLPEDSPIMVGAKEALKKMEII